MTPLEQRITDIITQEFLNNKKSWDEKTPDQINTRWVKWVSLHTVATIMNKTIAETMTVLSAMKLKGLVDSKLQINKHFYSCEISGFRQHAEKDYYTLVKQKS